MRKVYVYVMLTAFLFGTMEVALKLAGGQLDAFQLTFLRFLLGGVLLLPPALMDIRKKQLKFDGMDWMRLTVLGILCIPVSMVLFQLGIEGSNAATAAVLFSVNPLFTMILAHFFASEPMNRRKAAAFFLAVLGILAMMKPWDIQEGNTIMGMCFSLMGAFFFSVYTVYGKGSIQRLGPFVQNSFSFFIGCAVLLLIILATGRPVMTGVADNWMLVLYAGAVVTGLGYLFFFLAMRHSNATTASVAFFIKPVIAPIIAALVLGEVILWNTFLGIGLIVGASLLQMNVKDIQK